MAQRQALRAPRLVAVRPLASAAGAAPTAPSRPSWDIRLLYDGECPLCLREVDFLRSKNAANKVVFVDIAAADYNPAENAGISFERAMETIHGVTWEGRVLTGVEVFRAVYEAVGLGWVYAITKIPVVLTIANKIYDVWASNRTQLTGREALSVIVERRRLEEAGKASCRTPQAAGVPQQCDV